MPIVALTTPTNQQSQALTAAMQLAGAEKVHIGLHRDAQEGQALATCWAAWGLHRWNEKMEVVVGEGSQNFHPRGAIFLFFLPQEKIMYCIYLFLDSIVYDFVSQKDVYFQMKFINIVFLC